MPYQNEHAARVRDPDAFDADSFRRKNIAPGIDIIIGKAKGESSMSTQAYRFDSSKFTASEARDWLKKHNVDYIRFEAATGGKEQESAKVGDSMTMETRMLNAPIGKSENFVALGDGGLLVKNIIALAEGNWTDSRVRKPLFYPAKILQRDAPNWEARGLWSRHQGGIPRNITEKIGEIQNPRFSIENRAVMVDAYLHGRTQESRDVIELVKSGLLTDVSVEVGGAEVWNAETKRNEAVSLAFYGLATVDVGACNVCKLPRHHGACNHESGAGQEREGEDMGEETNQTPQPTESEKKLAVLESEKAELMKELAALKEKVQADEKAHAEKLETLTKQLAESEARVKELGQKAAPPKTLAGVPGTDGDKELAEPPMRVTGRNGEWFVA